MTSFPKSCDTQLGCSRCVFLQIARNKCTASERCVQPSKDYVIVQSKAKDYVNNQMCFAADHWLIVPTRGCTGVESKDPKCTGKEGGEKFWGIAWDVATTKKGFSGENLTGEKNIYSWGIYLNSVAWRSQHQVRDKN
jgi:hypothetical protein